MLKKTDKLIELLLYSPHVSDFIYQREDGSHYAQRRNHGEVYTEATKVDGKWIFGATINND